MFKARTHILPFLASTFALVVCASSCSVLIDTKKVQCDTDDECKKLNPSSQTKLTCSAEHICVAGSEMTCTKDEDCSALDSDAGTATCNDQGLCEAYKPPVLLDAKGCMEPAKSGEETVTLTFDVSLTAPPTKPADRHPFTIHGCNTTDPTCAAPVTEDFIVPYGEQAKIKVKPGFRGYLEITNPDGLNAVEFLGRPINTDTVGYGVIVPTPSTVTLLILATGEKYNAEQGIFVVTTRDCDRQPLRGVSVSNNLGGTGFIFINMSPQKDETQTSAEGAAGFVNVPAGLTNVSAILNGTQKMSSTSAYSRGGWVTYVEIFP